MYHKCPYCKTDLNFFRKEMLKSDSWQSLTPFGKPLGDNAEMITLCKDCGEPLLLSRRKGSTFRKPTDDEFAMLVETERYHEVRAAWLELDRRRKSPKPMPVAQMWAHYAGTLPSDTPERLRLIMKNVFVSGMSTMLAYVEYCLQDQETFPLHMQLIEAELKAMKEISDDEFKRRVNRTRTKH